MERITNFYAALDGERPRRQRPIPTFANARGTADANFGINRTLASW
jgi:hypothetical protein